MPYKARDVERALKAKGFQESPKRDHIFYFLFHKGNKSNIFTKMSHGSSEIDDRNCSSMARQIRLSRAQFKQFVECPLTYEQYIQVLLQLSHLNPND